MKDGAVMAQPSEQEPSADELERLRRWQADALKLLKDETCSPADWLKRRDDLVHRARFGT
jgi:hypothetical protein